MPNRSSIKEALEVALPSEEDRDRRALADALGKNPAAVALGRLGGLRGGKARAEALTKKRRHEIAKAAAEARWLKQKG